MISRERTKAKAVPVISVLVAAVAVTTAAHSQEDALPPRGEFALTISLADVNNSPAVPIGPGLTAAAVSQIAHVFSNDGGLLDHAVGICASFQIVDAAANTIEISGYCSYRDADGDYAYEIFSTDGGAPLGAMVLTGEWTGGTGKYAMLEGETTTTLAASIQAGDAIIIGGQKTGSYSLAGPEPEPVAAPAAPPADDNAALFAELMDEGADIYEDNCQFCHGADGQGTGAPRLAGNTYVRANASTVGLILGGYESHGMPAFANRLDTREVAAVATYVRNSWGNEYGITTEATVRQYALPASGGL